MWYCSTGTENVEHREGGRDARRSTTRYTSTHGFFGLRERQRGDLSGGRENTGRCDLGVPRCLHAIDATRVHQI